MSAQQELIIQALEAKTKLKVNRTKRPRDPFKPVPEFCARILKKYGSNQYGQPLYRVIWNESHETEIITGGLWGDTDTVEYRRVTWNSSKPRYILQKWLPPEEFGSPDSFFDTYSHNNNLEGGLWSDPIYPNRGRYEHVYTFANDILENPNYGEYEYPYIWKMILVCQCVDAGKLFTKQEKMDANKAARDAKEHAQKEQMRDVISDAMLPMEGTPYYNKMKEEYERRQKLTAEQTGLPTQGFSQLPR